MDNVKNTADKRGAKGGGTTRQRPDGRWEGRCTINGKRRSFYGEKQADVLKAMREAQQGEDKGVYSEPSKITVGQWMDVWLETYKRPILTDGSYWSYHQHIRNNIKDRLGKIKLQKLTSMEIQRFYNFLFENRKLAQKTVRYNHCILSGALDQAVKIGYISINPCKMCTLPKRKKDEINPLSEQEIEKFLKEIEKGERLSELYKVALFTGMRLGEICGLPWDAINFKDGTITVKQQLSRPCAAGASYRIAPTKSGKPRTITPAPFVMELIKQTRKDQLVNHLAAGEAWSNEFNLVFTDKVGHFIPSELVRKRFKRIVKRIGRPDSRFHDLRHTYAVMALQEGDSPKTVQENLGHATATFTLEVYAHVSEKMRKESAARMQAYYERIKA